MIDICFACCYLKVLFLPELCEQYIANTLSHANYLLWHDNVLSLGFTVISNKLYSLIDADLERFCATQLFLSKPSHFVLGELYNKSFYSNNLLWAILAWLKHKPQGEVAEYEFEPYTDIEEVRDTTCSHKANVYTFRREHVVKCVTQHVTSGQKDETKQCSWEIKNYCRENR